MKPTMARWMWLAFALLPACGAAQRLPSQATEARPSAAVTCEPRRTLRVVLYPYVPDAAALYARLERDFERAHPSVDVEVDTLSATYYDHRPGRGGIIEARADVYELDSVFLADFVANRRIQEVPSEAPLPTDMLAVADRATTLDGHRYGVPHWVCGNFLFYRADDAAMGGAIGTEQVARVVGASPMRDRGLLLDLKGKLTLGELYLDSLLDRVGTVSGLTPGLTVDNLPANPMYQSTLAGFRQLMSAVPSGYGRSDPYHDVTGFYGRQFARRHGRALVGYAESLHYVLDESMNSCAAEDQCLRGADLAVTEWASAATSSRTAVWTDMFVIDRAVTDPAKLSDARAFIQFMVGDDAYRAALVPGYGEAPRYLLPARASWYVNPEVTRSAPLYGRLRELIEAGETVTARNLNATLRTIGAQLDGDLPASH